MGTTQFGQLLSSATPLPMPWRGPRSVTQRIPILHDFSPQIRGPPGLSPFGVLLPIAAFQCLCFLMLPRGICLSMILHPHNLRSGETRVVQLWAPWWKAVQPPPKLFQTSGFPALHLKPEAILALPRSIQLLRLCRPPGAGHGTCSLGLWEVM